MIITLTQKERDKFAAWLEQNAKSDDAMATQMEKMGGIDMVAKRMKQRAALFSLVAQELRNIESTTHGAYCYGKISL